MDPASRSPDFPDRATSAEVSSTRPNPFDEGDITSRKRRRTSLSGSPADSLDTVNPILDSSSSTTLDTDPVLLRRDSATGSLPDTVAHKTPGSGSPMYGSSAEPPSSMVTLNLRNATQNDSSLSPPSPSPVAQPAATENAADAINDQVKESVEEYEVEMGPAPFQGPDTPRSSSLHSPSPPIEVITEQSDEDMILDRQSIGVSIVEDDLVLVDPIHEFPFKEHNESLEGMVTRLSSYLTNHSSIDASVIYKLHLWLEQYLEYVATSDWQSAADSCRFNISFWMAFPRIVTAMVNHRPPLYDEESLRDATKAFLTVFTKLSAWFVSQDIQAMREYMMDQSTQNQRSLDLFSPFYLTHLHMITHPLLSSGDRTSYPEFISSYFIRVYLDSPGGSLSHFLQLTRSLVDLAHTIPQLTNDLAPVCQLMSDIVADMSNLRDPETAVKAKDRLETGHALYELAYGTLDNMIEKKPTQLVPDNVLRTVQALSDIIKASLNGDHPAAINMIQEHREAFPTAPRDYTIEAIACEQRFHIFIKLVRSSQMQLRFQGATQMCSDLVACWREHSDHGRGGSLQHIEHLAEYLIQTGFIDYFLGSNCHPEITVEGANIVGFIIVTKKCRQEHIDMVWQGITSGQDPRTADALTRMVVSICNLFDQDGLLAFCEKFKTLPVDAFTPAIRSLWENVMKFIAEKSTIDEPLAFLPYGICLRMLEFLRVEILPRLNERADLALDDKEAVSHSGIEQLWRLVLEAEDESLAERSIRTLAIEVYIENRFITLNAVQRTRSIHLRLVDRCLQQLKDAAKMIKTFGQNATSGDNKSTSRAVASQQLQQQEMVFVRSLKFLRYILEAHQSKPHLSAPDLRTLISQTSYEIRGDPAGLKYQSFDGDHQTDIRPLVMGKGNTAASLLASLRKETGFENYRVYYRGRPFLPNEHDICKSLDDLRVHDGLILVRREESGPALSNRVRPGASPLEIEISTHFDEMWEYLSMEETLAQEIYYFLVKLPTDGHILKLIDNESASYNDIFPCGQPFKSLYAVHALVEYTEPPLPDGDDSNVLSSSSESEFVQYSKALKTAISFVVQAISDENVFDGASMFLRLKLTCGLLHAFRRFLDRIDTPRGSATSKELAMPEPARLVDILTYAVGCPGEVPSPAVAGTLVICLRLSMLDDGFWTKLSTNSDFARILQRLILMDPRQAIRSLSAKLVEELFTVLDHAPATSEPSCEASTGTRDVELTKYFWTIVSDLVAQTASFPSQCGELFSLAHFLLARIKMRAPDLFDIATFAACTSNLLLRHTTTETIESPCVEDINLAMLLFSKQLYPSKGQSSGQPVPRVILHEETRAKLCEVILSLVKHDQNKMKEVVYGLHQQVPFYDEDEEDEPYLYELSYHFDRLGALRAPCGYVGLQNLSNTCYLNSLMTQLYMNTGFRRFVLNCQITDAADSQQLLFYTQKLFGHMQGSYLRSIDPSTFVNSIKTYDDTLIDIHNQMDVDEFYNLLFDRWESQLLDNDEKKMMKSFYGGQLVQQVKSKECEHISERLEPFSAIQCDIKGKSTLTESLQAYVGGEIMEGDNKYKCSMCDTHVDAVKRACLKDVPDNLIFHLKRFDFNLRTLQRSKINDYFSNPESDVEEDIFELVGVLVHSGTAESGHYYSYIRERPSSANRPTWVEFNDDMVTHWDPAHMEYSTFGGTDPRSLYDNNGMVCDKNYSAYMLFYQRASSLRAEQDKMMNLGVSAPLRVQVPEELDDHIMDLNTQTLRRHCIYDQSNIRLAQCLFHQSQHYCQTAGETDTHQSIDDFVAKSQLDHGLQDLAMQTLVGNLDQVVTRTKDIPDLPTYSKSILEAVGSCGHCAFSYYSYFKQHPRALRILLQRNPDQGVRSFVGKSFITALATMSRKLPQVYDPQISYSPDSELDGDEDEYFSGPIAARRSVIHGVMILLDYLWKFFHIHIRAWDEYFGTVLNFARLGYRETEYVLAARFLAKTIQIISADSLQDLDGNWAKMLHNLSRRSSTRQTSYASIIALAHHLMDQMDSRVGPNFSKEQPTERVSQMTEPFKWTPGECIRGETSTQAMDPFLRAAITYIESTDQLRNAKEIVGHIFIQAKSLQNTEGVYFLRFFKTALNLKQQDTEFAGAVRSYALERVPTWVPYLLASQDRIVRTSTESFLIRALFDVATESAPNEDDSDDDNTWGDRDIIKQTTKQVGIACLKYLREQHVRKRNQVIREVANRFLKVIGQCVDVLNSDPSTQTELDLEFLALQDDVLGPLHRLTVDEMEEDGSGMLQSLSDSDTITADLG
ncbi:uncharacterized protein QYS62_003649 [Fusarium acuminatum]|uniref:USP domain-containing protein n=1 Tax=Fusarium acuminatum TaxID=5515 RepID=A0ABZ2WS86_9HYPO